MLVLWGLLLSVIWLYCGYLYMFLLCEGSVLLLWKRLGWWWGYVLYVFLCGVYEVVLCEMLDLYGYDGLLFVMFLLLLVCMSGVKSLYFVL